MSLNVPEVGTENEILIPPNVQYVIGVDNVVTNVLTAGSTPSVTYNSETDTLTFNISTGTTGADGEKGDTGSAGAIGETGASGSDGTDGKTWYADDGSPDGGTGVNGDFYYDKLTDSIYRKEVGTWQLQVNLGGMDSDVYDPQDIQDDAFDTDNHTDGSTNGVYTLAERTLVDVGTSLDTTATTLPSAVNEVKATADGAVQEYDYDANTMMIATSDNTPVASTATQVRTFINVEDGATADQSDEEIKTAYENNANTNAYTDSEQTKVGHISVTQAVDLDDIESDLTNVRLEIDTQFAQHGLIPNDKVNEIKPSSFFKEVVTANTVSLADDIYSGYKIRFTDGIYSFSSQIWSLSGHASPFVTYNATDTDELLDDTTNGLTTQYSHSKGDIVVTSYKNLYE